MKISRVECVNFQGLRSARLQFSKPITLVSGKNGAGKSTLLEAIRLALLGNSERVALKKELAKLVSDGAKRGGIDVITENQLHYAYTLPDGKHTAPVELGGFIGYVLDAQNFACAAPDVRRSSLFALTGCKINSEEIGKRLAQRGAPQARIDLVLPMLRSGFSAACAIAKEQATQARGAWKAITGETYGEKKADAWVPVAVEGVPGYQLRNAEAEAKEIEVQQSELNQKIGTARAELRQVQDATANIQALKDKAGNLKRHQDKLAIDQAELDKWDGKIAEAKASNASTKINKPAAKIDNALLDAFAVVTSEFIELAKGTRGTVNNFGVCFDWNPNLINRASCHLATYTVQHGAPLAMDAEEEAAPVTPRLSELEASRDLYRRAVDNDRRDIAAAENAAQQLVQMGERVASAPNPVDVQSLDAELKTLQVKLQAARYAITSLNTRRAAYKAAQDSEAKALAHHKDVIEWAAIAEALAPDGIPSEILAGALRPANDYLHELAQFANWMRVQIGTEMDITADGRPYALLSESEKWRTDCLLALTIAKLSGLKLVLLDRFDVLDMTGRGDVIDLLDDMALRGEVETAILCGTLKQMPTEMPETFETIWIDNGEINNLKLDNEAA